MAEIFFWIAVGSGVYTYAGYSLIVILLALIVRNSVNRHDIEPKVTVLITAYNEERNIAQKLENTLALDYPRGKLEILVASDGSTDKTDEIVRSFGNRGVRLVRVEGRVGKTETQNRAVREATGEVVVFSDATTRYETANLRKIVRNYADPEVGAVSGRYEYINPGNATIGVGSIVFWKYENAIKTAQTRIKTISGCCGCIYSVRRSLYEPLPADIISDLVEPLKILEKGYRIVFEPEAIAYEETTEKTAEEFNMRVRVITRGMRGMLYMHQLFNPFRFGFVAFQLISHKLLRWMVAFMMLVAFVANFLLLGNTFYNVMFALQCLFYLLAGAGLVAERRNFRSKLFSLPLYFCTVNWAAVVAMYRVWRGQKAVTWETVRR